MSLRDPSQTPSVTANEDEHTITSDILTIADDAPTLPSFPEAPRSADGQDLFRGISTQPSEDGSITSGIESMAGIMTTDGSFFDQSQAHSNQGGAQTGVDGDFRKKFEEETYKVLSEYGMLETNMDKSRSAVDSELTSTSGGQGLGAVALGASVAPAKKSSKSTKGPPPVGTSGARMGDKVKKSSVRIVRSLRKQTSKTTVPTGSQNNVTRFEPEETPASPAPKNIIIPIRKTPGTPPRTLPDTPPDSPGKPPSVILVESDGSDAQEKKAGEVPLAAPWPRCLGRRFNMIVVILAIILLISIAIVCGALVAINNEDEKTDRSASSAQGEQGVIFIPPTSSPTVGVTPVPTLSPGWNSTLCGTDDNRTRFFVNDDTGRKRCPWLAEEPVFQQSLCVPGTDAWTICLETCKNCAVPEPPSPEPTEQPAPRPTHGPTRGPTPRLTQGPTRRPTPRPTQIPTRRPTPRPTQIPTRRPTPGPTSGPTRRPTLAPISPTMRPTLSPVSPTSSPVSLPTSGPVISTAAPVVRTESPVAAPSTPRGIVVSSAPTAVQSEIAQAGSPSARAASFVEETSQGMEPSRVIQRFALADLAFSTNRSRRRLQTGWLNGDECDWSGVSCRNNVVTGVDVSNQNLRGTIPRSLSMLKDLISLDISRNNFSGEIPREFGNLRQIQTLRMESNRIEGNFAEDLGNMRALREWYIETNELEGAFPNSVLLALTNLEQFSVYHNDLTGVVADGICERDLTVFAIDCREIDSGCWTRCFFQCGGNTGVPCN